MTSPAPSTTSSGQVATRRRAPAGPRPSPFAASGLLVEVGRAWPKLAVAIVLGALIGLVVASRAAATTTATTDLFVAPTYGNTATELNRGRVAAERAAASLGGIATSNSVLTTVISDLKLKQSPKELGAAISIDYADGSQLVSISYADASADRARSVVKAVSAATAHEFADLAGRTSSGGPAMRATELGTSAENPTRPAPWSDMLLGSAVLTLLALVHTGGRYVTNEKIHNRRAISELTSAPVLTISPQLGHRREAVDETMIGPVVLGWLQQDPGSTVFLADTHDSSASLTTASWLARWAKAHGAGIEVVIEDEKSLEFEDSPFRAMVLSAHRSTASVRSDWTALLTVVRHSTELADLERAITFLEFRGFTLLGIVLVNPPRRFLVSWLMPRSRVHPQYRKLVSVGS